MQASLSRLSFVTGSFISLASAGVLAGQLTVGTAAGSVAAAMAAAGYYHYAARHL